MLIPASVLRIVIDDQGHLQVTVEGINLGRLEVVRRGSNMPNSPGKTQVIEGSQFKHGSVVRDN
jgi:hypothetical protein